MTVHRRPGSNPWPCRPSLGCISRTGGIGPTRHKAFRARDTGVLPNTANPSPKAFAYTRGSAQVSLAPAASSVPSSPVWNLPAHAWGTSHN